MQIQVHTDNHIDASSDFVQRVEEILTEKLQRFGSRITRIEVHFTDENSAAKSGPDDKKCVLEARLNGMQPVAVSATAPNLIATLRGAIDKLRSLLDSTLGKLNA
jgi:ribosome-associated translation inhibitor RaiA